MPLSSTLALISYVCISCMYDGGKPLQLLPPPSMTVRLTFIIVYDRLEHKNSLFISGRIRRILSRRVSVHRDTYVDAYLSNLTI